MIIQLYEGTLQNRAQLCRELRVAQGPDRGAVSRATFDQEILRNCWRSFLEGSDEVWPIPYMVYVFVLWYETCFDKEAS